MRTVLAFCCGALAMASLSCQHPTVPRLSDPRRNQGCLTHYKFYLDIMQRGAHDPALTLTSRSDIRRNCPDSVWVEWYPLGSPQHLEHFDPQVFRKTHARSFIEGTP